MEIRRNYLRRVVPRVIRMHLVLRGTSFTGDYRIDYLKVTTVIPWRNSFANYSEYIHIFMLKFFKLKFFNYQYFLDKV